MLFYKVFVSNNRETLGNKVYNIFRKNLIKHYNYE